MRRARMVVLVVGLVVLGYFYLQARRSFDILPYSVGPVMISDSVLTIAFGSCNHQNDPQDYWETIAGHRPAAWPGSRYGASPDGELRGSNARAHLLPGNIQMLPAGRANNAALTAFVHPKAATDMMLKPCPESPNCVSTQSTQPKKKRDPIPFTGTAEQARAKLKRVIGDMSRSKLESEEGNYLHYTFKTWPIPYTDDVEFIIDPARKVIDYRSASRVGHSDLGVNSRRMAKVVSAFAAE